MVSEEPNTGCALFLFVIALWIAGNILDFIWNVLAASW